MQKNAGKIIITFVKLLGGDNGSKEEGEQRVGRLVLYPLGIFCGSSVEFLGR